MLSEQTKETAEYHQQRNTWLEGAVANYITTLPRSNQRGGTGGEA